MKKLPLTQEKDQKLNETDLQQPNNVVKLVHSGDGPPTNWLRSLELGTVFLSRKKANLGNTQDFTLGEFCVRNKTEKSVLLTVVDGGVVRPLPVDPMRFCNQMELFEILNVINFEEYINDDNQGTV